jgi:hypothetical protein
MPFRFGLWLPFDICVADFLIFATGRTCGVGFGGSGVTFAIGVGLTFVGTLI